MYVHIRKLSPGKEDGHHFSVERSQNTMNRLHTVHFQSQQGRRMDAKGFKLRMYAV